MYSSLLFFVIFLLPIPILIVNMRKEQSPYRTWINSILGTGVGICAVFLASNFWGVNLFTEFESSVDQVMDVLSAQIKDTAFLDNYRSLYLESVKIMPATLLVMAAFISYVEYLVLSRFIKKNKTQPVLRMPPLREFSLPRNTIFGWFIIFIIAWILKAVGVPAGEMVALNINVLFEFTFALQGVSLILLTAHLKKFPKPIAVIGLIIAWILPFGRTALFFIGIADLILSIRLRLVRK